jgi:S1-C subfamily serine protease
MRLQLVIREAGVQRTHVPLGPEVRLGTDALCEVRFAAQDSPMVAPLHARISAVGMKLMVESLQGSVLLVDGVRSDSAELGDGTVLTLGLDGPQVQVYRLHSRARGRTFAEVVEDASLSTRMHRSRMVRAVNFGTQVLKQSLVHGTRGLRLAVMGLGAVVVALVALLLHEIQARKESEARITRAIAENAATTRPESEAVRERRLAEERAAQEKLRSEDRARHEQALAELARSFARQTEQLQKSVEEASTRAVKAEERLAQLEKLSAAARDLYRRNLGSVGMLETGVSFFSPQEKAFVRFAEGKGGRAISGSSGALVLGGEGRRYVEWHSGTGFLVSADGLVVSNRHVVDPWHDDEDFGEGLLSLGFRPVREQCLFSFAGSTEVVDAARVSAHPSLDVALVRLSGGAQGRTPVKLAAAEHVPSVGGEVFLLGFPLGIEGLFTKLDGDKAKAVMQGSFTDAGALLRRIAAINGVQPSFNAGVLGNVLSEQLFYDASTTHGASGSPLFESSGEVIGVNRAITRFGGANIGIPVRAVHALLAQPPEARPPEPELLSSEAAEASNAPKPASK